MADAQSAEAKELALVGKVEMRIALASSEKKLEDLLKMYLAPLLLKLGSDHVAVRNKVGISSTISLSSLISTSSSALSAANGGVLCIGHLHLPAHQHPHPVTVRICFSLVYTCLAKLTLRAETSSSP
jgi:hypothetical protein